ncbi:MAG: DNA ligase, partial [Eubacteriales bacterium]
MAIEFEWPVIPMEPVARADAFDSEDTLFQVKWDGVRVLAYAFPGGVRLFNRRLHERTQQYPELVDALEGLPPGTVLDGEIVALAKNGKPNFPRVLRRDLVHSLIKIKQAALAVPVHYMVFDVLWYAGRETMSLPLWERLEIMDGLKLFPGNIMKVDCEPKYGTALFEAVRNEGLEGIVAKKTDSIYIIG